YTVTDTPSSRGSTSTPRRASASSRPQRRRRALACRAIALPPAHFAGRRPGSEPGPRSLLRSRRRLSRTPPNKGRTRPQKRVQAGESKREQRQGLAHVVRSEEHTSELQSRGHLV